MWCNEIWCNIFFTLQILIYNTVNPLLYNAVKAPVTRHQYSKMLGNKILKCQRACPTSFSPVTCTNVQISPWNFLNFIRNPFTTLVQNFKFAASASPKLLKLSQDHPSKKVSGQKLSGQILIKLRLW